MISFGQKIKKLRTEMGYSQAYLAELVGVSTQSISNWECDNSMPDISQIVPLAGSLMVSTDFLLGVGMDETLDKAKLEQKVSEIWAYYTVNSKEENADILVSELYLDFLRKYPMDYYVKYKCALALHDYLIVVTVRHKFEITAKEIDSVYAKCDKLLNSIIDNSVDLELKIDACMLKVNHLLLNSKYEEAKAVAFKLPKNGGMQDSALSKIMKAEGKQDEANKKFLEAAKRKCLEYLMSLCEYASQNDYALDVLKSVEMIAADAVNKYMDVIILGVNQYEEMPYCYYITAFTMQCNKYIKMNDYDSAYECLKKATQSACDMYAWVKEHTDDKMILEDYKFFVSKTPHWAFSFSGVFDNESNKFTESQEYNSCVEAINKAMKE